MSLFRVTLFFQAGNNGWSESIHTTRTVVSGIISDLNGLVPARADILGQDVFITHIRISDDLVFRDVYFDPLPLPIIGTGAGEAVTEAPWVALDVRMTAGPQVQRSLFLRGIPDRQTHSSIFLPTPKFQSNLNKWIAQLRNGTWGIKNKDRTLQKQPIISITPGGLITTVVPVGGTTVGGIVQILGIPRSQLPKREYIIDSLPAFTQIQVRGWQGQTFAGVGFARADVKLIIPFDQIIVDNVTERRTGRPFGLLRGRRAVVR